MINPIGGPLTSADFASLAGRWIDPETAAQQFLRRVNTIDGSAVIGRNGAGNFAGLLIPNVWPGSDYIREYRLRRDNPDLENGRPKMKYLSPPGRSNLLYVPVGTDPAWLSDPGVPVVVTEGEFKTIALARAARHDWHDAKPRFLAIGLSGVWNWKGTVGKATDADGARVDVKGPIPDLERVFWNGRKVTIVFDSNTATNPYVNAARRQLARELTRRGAEVWVADLPPVSGVNGVDDFLGLFGLEETLEVLESAQLFEWRKDLIRSDNGKILAVLANALTALRGAPEWCGVLAFDEFSFCVTTTRDTPWGRVGKWSEQDDRLLADWFQHHGIRVSDVEAGKAAETVARDRSYHPVREYLDSLQWDKQERLDDWLTTYLGVKSSNLTQAFASKWMISAVARVYRPGCKADHCLIVEGPQGSFKSSAFRVLGEPWFTDDVADLGSKDAALATIGTWIIELAELDAITRSELSRVKAFMSRSTDRFRPPYGRRLIESPRQCVFVGTVNHSEYLRDETGGRRFWPVVCGRIDLNSLRRDRDQLWAEAVARYRRGEHWWLETPKLNTAAASEQDARYMPDAWESLVSRWLKARSIDVTRTAEVTTADVLDQALLKPRGTWTRGDEVRIGVILRRLGWKPYRPRRAGTRLRIYRGPRSN